MGLNTNEQRNLQDKWKKRRVRKDSSICHFGDDFHSFFAVKTGSFKSFVNTEDGREQIINFHFPGDLIALESIALGYFRSTVKSLEDSIICQIPYVEAVKVISPYSEELNPLVNLLSVKINQDVRIFPSATGVEKLAEFLLYYHFRLDEIFSFSFPMSRAEIANFLGLSTETISRLFSKMQKQGVIKVSGKKITILDVRNLKKMCPFSG
ncbi:MAG TPA: helix-turn-helix domain-containing protein [Gammaproteobacteria bacterium]|nr:helix-turn-helix domain-containing protein [Gammaproteobacteria bacterium]